MGAMYVLVRGTFEDLAFLDAPSPPRDPPQFPANAPISGSGAFGTTCLN